MLKLDVTKRKEIDDLDEQLADKTIDILYLNAGVMGSHRSIPFGELESPEWEDVLRVNSVTPVIVVQKLLPRVWKSGTKTISVGRIASLGNRLFTLLSLFPRRSPSSIGAALLGAAGN